MLETVNVDNLKMLAMELGLQVTDFSNWKSHQPEEKYYRHKVNNKTLSPTSPTMSIRSLQNWLSSQIEV